MDALTPVRAAALRLRGQAGFPHDTLAPGTTIAQAVARHLRLPVAPLPPGDPLLAGARALLDRTLGLIAVSRGLPPSAQAFSVAHEVGHAVLHAADARCAPADALDDDLDPTLLETYSPLQRREAEASAFAAELLAPATAVRAAFLGEDTPPMTPQQIAAAFGLAEGLVLAQLAVACFGDDARLAVPTAGSSVQKTARAVLDRLDADQRAAATVEQGPVVVDAGPGAGKTLTLLGRIAFLLERGEAPAGILVLTFSVAAANELRERLRVGLPGAAGVTVSTIHAFALDLLRRYSAAAGLPFDLRVLDGFAGRRLLATLLPQLPLQEHRNLHDPAEPLGALAQAIGRAQDEAWSPEVFAQQAAALPVQGSAARWARRAQEAAAIYRAWLDIMHERGAVDFGEMVRRALELVRARPDIRDALRAQYRAVLVDEYQDTNRATALLLRELAGDGRGLWVVGDARQAIYRFRGAAPGNFRAFAADFPGARRLPLRHNYRSRPQIVTMLQAAAPALLPDEPAAQWEAVRRGGGGPAAALAVALDGAAELRGLAEAIAARHAAGTPLRDQAVLCRTHAQAEEVAAALQARGLPALAALPFTGAAGVRAVLGALAVLAGDAAGLLPLAATLGRSVTPDEVRRLAAAPDALPVWREGEGQAIGEGIARLYADHAAERDAYRTLLRLVFAPDGPARRLTSLAPADALRERSALRHLLLLAAAARRDPLADGAPLTPGGLLDWLRARIAAGEGRAAVPEGDAADAVQVLTVHAAKGREFPVVYVPNLAEGRFPPRGRRPATPLPPDLSARGDSAGLEEEAALLFVAMSRARDHLVLSHAQSYDGVTARPSPLLRRLQGVFTALPPVRLRWDGAPAPEAALSPAAAPGPVAVALDDLAWYRRCPRQYFYGEVLGLAPANDGTRSDTSALARGIVATLAWLRAQADGALPSPDAAAAFFAGWWDRHGKEHPYAQEGAAAGRQAARRAVGLPRTPGAPYSISVEFEGVTIMAAADVATVMEDGSLRLTLALAGASGEGERAADRAAVLRIGARQAGWAAEVETIALLTGDRRPLPAGPAEDVARISLLAETARALAAGRFPARPDRRERCPTCPFVLVCPA